MRADALENVPEVDREALADLTDAYSAQALDLADLPQPEGPPRQWDRQEIGKLMADEMNKPRDLERGKTMFAAALCLACHRFGEEGGLIGPDLTTIGTRFSRHDILEAIDSPSDAISDQYSAELITLTDGKTYIGRVVGEEDGVVLVNQNPYDPNQQVELRTADIEERETSSVSIMPPRLFNRLNEEEVLDLMAYLISGGDPAHRCYTADEGCEAKESDD